MSCTPAKKLAPACLQHAEAAPENPETIETLEESQMLLKNETLTPQARKHFGLARSPFVDDINSRADVFASQHSRYVRAAMLEAATNHGFIAIIGQSGSGKSIRYKAADRELGLVAEGRAVLSCPWGGTPGPLVAGDAPGDAEVHYGFSARQITDDSTRGFA